MCLRLVTLFDGFLSFLGVLLLNLYAGWNNWWFWLSGVISSSTQLSCLIRCLKPIELLRQWRMAYISLLSNFTQLFCTSWHPALRPTLSYLSAAILVKGFWNHISELKIGSVLDWKIQCLILVNVRLNGKSLVSNNGRFPVLLNLIKKMSIILHWCDSTPCRMRIES
jgi:hypothetical protein